MKSIHGQRYKIIQLRLTILLVFWTALLHIQLCSGLAGLAGSRNAVLYAVHAMQLYRVQGLTPPIHACAVRVMNFGAETKFEKGASDRNLQSGLCKSWTLDSGLDYGLSFGLSRLMLPDVRDDVTVCK